MNDLSKNNNIETEAEGLPDGFLILDDQGVMYQFNKGDLQPYKQKKITQKTAPISTELLDTGMEEPMLQPPPLAVLKNSAAFYFHPEDEEEVLKVSSKTLVEGGPRQFSVQKIADKVENSFGLTLSVDGKKRLTQIILMAMRDRRSLMDTEDLLADTESSLGLGLPSPVAGALMIFIKQIKEKITAEGGLVVDELVIGSFKNDIKSEKPAQLPKSETKQKKSVIEEIIKEIKSGKSVSDVSEANNIKTEDQKFEKQDEKAKQMVSDEFTISLNLREAINQKTVEERNRAEMIKKQAKKAVVFDKPPTNNLSRFVKTVKPPIADIKIDNKSVGPIDELSLINLVTFRRISADPVVASQRIIGIVTALGKQSLSRKMAGIGAWRKSPLYRQYLTIGQMSMETGKYIPDVISDLKAKGTDVMTLVEFEAISDINKQTRM